MTRLHRGVDSRWKRSGCLKRSARGRDGLQAIWWNGVINEAGIMIRDGVDRLGNLTIISRRTNSRNGVGRLGNRTTTVVHVEEQRAALWLVSGKLHGQRLTGRRISGIEGMRQMCGVPSR